MEKSSVSLARRARPEELLEAALLEAGLRNSERPEELLEEALRNSERLQELLEAARLQELLEEARLELLEEARLELLEEALLEEARPGENSPGEPQHAWPTCLSASAGMRSTPPPTRG